MNKSVVCRKCKTLAYCLGENQIEGWSQFSERSSNLKIEGEGCTRRKAYDLEEKNKRRRFYQLQSQTTEDGGVLHILVFQMFEHGRIPEKLLPISGAEELRIEYKCGFFHVRSQTLEMEGWFLRLRPPKI